MQLTPTQQAALEKIERWYNQPQHDSWFYLAGVSGSGKTTLLGKFLEGTPDLNTVFMAYTGKAAARMREVGLPAHTIHSQLYQPYEDNKGNLRFELAPSTELMEADLIVLDEVSMVGEKLGSDLEGLGIPLLVVGDPAQLPPVGDDAAFFTSKKPDVLLTEVHRQALESPLLRLAMSLRLGMAYKPMQAPGVDIRKDPIRLEELQDFDQVICGRNAIRKRINNALKRGGDWPVVGDKVICLRNNRNLGVYNGEQFTVQGTKSREVKVDDRWLPVLPEGFTDEKEALAIKQRDLAVLTWAYAITVHKSQGSEWNRVCLIDHNDFAYLRDGTRKKFLYTAVTRARKSICIARLAK